jgi:hypothetical protein
MTRSLEMLPVSEQIARLQFVAQAVAANSCDCVLCVDQGDVPVVRAIYRPTREYGPHDVACVTGTFDIWRYDPDAPLTARLSMEFDDVPARAAIAVLVDDYRYLKDEWIKRRRGNDN